MFLSWPGEYSGHRASRESWSMVCVMFVIPPAWDSRTIDFNLICWVFVVQHFESEIQSAGVWRGLVRATLVTNVHTRLKSKLRKTYRVEPQIINCNYSQRILKEMPPTHCTGEFCPKFLQLFLYLFPNLFPTDASIRSCEFDAFGFWLCKK